MLAYDVAEGAPEPALTEAELAQTLQLVLDQLGIERACEVSLTVVSDAEMAQINAEWRGIDAATDVISLECENPEDPDLPEGVPCELGDIIIAPTYLGVQASRYQTTPADETRLMVIHGMLHLLGYDHIDPDEAREMEALEDQLLALATAGRLEHAKTTRHADETPKESR